MILAMIIIHNYYNNNHLNQLKFSYMLTGPIKKRDVHFHTKLAAILNQVIPT